MSQGDTSMSQGDTSCAVDDKLLYLAPSAVNTTKQVPRYLLSRI